jgi:hypothetical protein
LVQPPLSPSAYAIRTIDSQNYVVRLDQGQKVADALAAMGCGDRACAIGDAGQVFVVHQGKTTLAIQVTTHIVIRDLMKTIGCSETFICGTDGKTVSVIARMPSHK